MYLNIPITCYSSIRRGRLCANSHVRIGHLGTLVYHSFRCIRLFNHAMPKQIRDLLDNQCYPYILSVTLKLHSPTILFVIISGYNVPLMICCCFSTILNYYLLRKSDAIKITCTHSMAMMISDGLN